MEDNKQIKKSEQIDFVIGASTPFNKSNSSEGVDIVKELKVSAAAEEKMAENSPERRKKVLALKNKYQAGELTAADSRSLARKLIDKLKI